MKTPEQKRAYQREQKRQWRKVNAAKLLDYGRQWREKNRQSVRTYLAQWRLDNPDKVKLMAAKSRRNRREQRLSEWRKWRRAHKEKCYVRSVQWKKAHPERAKEYSREFYARNRKSRLAYNKAWAKRNPERKKKYGRTYYRRFPERALINVEKRRARLLGATVEDCSARIKFLRTVKTCSYCLGNIIGTTHVDHIIPLSRGGKHCSDNLAASCIKCNGSKGARLLSEWKPNELKEAA